MPIQVVPVGHDDDGPYFYEVREPDTGDMCMVCLFETLSGWMHDFNATEEPHSELRFESRDDAIAVAISVAFGPRIKVGITRSGRSGRAKTDAPGDDTELNGRQAYSAVASLPNAAPMGIACLANSSGGDEARAPCFY